MEIYGNLSKARELAEPLYSEFIKRGYFNEKDY